MEALLKSALQGEIVSWPTARTDELRFLEFTLQNGIQPLLHYFLRQSQSLQKWPEQIHNALESEAKRQIAIDTFRDRNLKDVLESFAEQNIFPLLLKGTPLAYLYYPDSSLRPRCDTDLLIRKEDLEKVEAILKKSGYSRSNSVSGNFIRHQFLYCKSDLSSVGCDLDIHWKISNPSLFADIFNFDELQSRSIGIARLSEYARTLSPADSLLMACLHRVAHHHNMERLIWLYDIHLLAKDLTQNQFDEFCERAAQKKLMKICWNGLLTAQSWFNTNLPQHQTNNDFVEPSAEYLRSDLRSFDLL
ncbi:MAG TPA: nucleotidyltransferase family protein, partial [Acidobacteriota bacterium]